jgi:hypothetical protein
MADKPTTHKTVQKDYKRALESMGTYMDIEVNDPRWRADWGNGGQKLPA